MKLSRFEFWAMNIFLRKLLQKFEIVKMRQISQIPAGQKILEIGCGSGSGAKLISQKFRSHKIHAIDFDEKMIAIARRKISDEKIEFAVGDATNLQFENASFDAVFDFATLHHVENWKKALREIHRVLRPGGEFLIEEFSREFFESLFGKIVNFFAPHKVEKIFRRDEFFATAKKIGFKISARKSFFGGKIFFGNLKK
jgi:ubiquinone/menaquinone biosynthesis C-methylase UbiE